MCIRDRIREVKEETGLDVKYPKICGIKWWEVSKNKRYVVLLFKTNEYCGPGTGGQMLLL